MDTGNNKQSITTESIENTLRQVFNKVFKKNDNGFLWEEFLEYARQGENGKEIATSLFLEAWRIIVEILYTANAPVFQSEVETFCQKWLIDPKTDESYINIAYEVFNDGFQHQTFQTFREQRYNLEKEEEYTRSDLENRGKIERADLLSSLIRLAFSPTKRIPDTIHMRDRILACFSEDLGRLIIQYLNTANMTVTIAELKDLIVKHVPIAKKYKKLLNLVDNYERVLQLKQPDKTTEIEEQDLPEVELELITVSTVIVGDKIHIQGLDNHFFGIEKKSYEFSVSGLTQAIGDLIFEPNDPKEFENDLKRLLFKIMDALTLEKTYSKAFSLLGDYRTMLYGLKIKLQKKLERTPKTMWKATEIKMNSIINCIGPVEAEISEGMPMSLRTAIRTGYSGYKEYKTPEEA